MQHTMFLYRAEKASMKTSRTATICFLALITLRMDGNETTSSSASTETPALTQQERAEAAMEKSLAQQQAALDGSRQNTDTGSVHQQQDSLQQQASVLEGQDKESRGSLSSKPAKQPDELEAKQTNFFALPWPSSMPLATPNVQMMDESCQALNKTEIDQLIGGAGKRHNVDADLLRSVMRQESGLQALCGIGSRSDGVDANHARYSRYAEARRSLRSPKER